MPAYLTFGLAVHSRLKTGAEKAILMEFFGARRQDSALPLYRVSCCPFSVPSFCSLFSSALAPSGLLRSFIRQVKRHAKNKTASSDTDQEGTATQMPLSPPSRRMPASTPHRD